MVAGLLKPDAGRVEVLGHDVADRPEAAKRMLAFLPDDPLLYDKLTPLEYLEFVAGLWSVAAGEPRAARRGVAALARALATGATSAPKASRAACARSSRSPAR